MIRPYKHCVFCISTINTITVSYYYGGYIHGGMSTFVSVVYHQKQCSDQGVIFFDFLQTLIAFEFEKNLISIHLQQHNKY